MVKLIEPENRMWLLGAVGLVKREVALLFIRYKITVLELWYTTYCVYLKLYCTLQNLMSVDLMLGIRCSQQKQNKNQRTFGDDGYDCYFVVMFSRCVHIFKFTKLAYIK